MPSGSALCGFRDSMAAPLGDAVKAALKSALERVYDGARLQPNVVAALVAYFAGRGEALTDLSFDYLSRGSVEDFERRWLAKLRAATIADEGDQVDFILWTKARSAPSGGRGAEAKKQPWTTEANKNDAQKKRVRNRELLIGT